jgi:hypothetical protein
MTTTAIIVDILIIGFFALCWIFLLLIKCTPLDLTSFNSIPKNIEPWITPITFGIIFFCYQLGLLINWLGTFIEKPILLFFKVKPRDSIYKNEDLNYDDVKAIIDQYGSAEIHKYLREDLIIIRLVRSGIINFLLIFVFLILNHYWKLSIISFLVMVLCLFYYLQRYKIYYYRILNVYKIMPKEKQLSD